MKNIFVRFLFIFYFFKSLLSSNVSVDSVLKSNATKEVGLPEMNTLTFFDQHINKIITTGISIICLGFIIVIVKELNKLQKKIDDSMVGNLVKSNLDFTNLESRLNKIEDSFNKNQPLIEKIKLVPEDSNNDKKNSEIIVFMKELLQEMASQKELAVAQVTQLFGRLASLIEVSIKNPQEKNVIDNKQEQKHQVSNKDDLSLKNIISELLSFQKATLEDDSKSNQSLIKEFQLSLEACIKQFGEIAKPTNEDQFSNKTELEGVIQKVFELQNNNFQKLLDSIHALVKNNGSGEDEKINKQTKTETILTALQEIIDTFNRSIKNIIEENNKNIKSILNNDRSVNVIEMSEKKQISSNYIFNESSEINKPQSDLIEKALKKLYDSINYNDEDKESNYNEGITPRDIYAEWIHENYIKNNGTKSDEVKKILFEKYINFSLQDFFDDVICKYLLKNIELDVLGCSYLENNTNIKKYLKSAFAFFRAQICESFKIDMPLPESLKRCTDSITESLKQCSTPIKDLNKSMNGFIQKWENENKLQVDREEKQKSELIKKEEKRLRDEKNTQESMDGTFCRIIDSKSAILKSVTCQEDTIDLKLFFEVDQLEDFFQIFNCMNKRKSLSLKEFFDLFLSFFNYIDYNITWDFCKTAQTKNCKQFLSLINKLYKAFMRESMLREKDTERSINFFYFENNFLFKYKYRLDNINTKYKKNCDDVITKYDYKKKFNSETDKESYESVLGNKDFIDYFKIYNDLFEVYQLQKDGLSICRDLFFKKILEDIVTQSTDGERENEKRKGQNKFIEKIQEELKKPAVFVSRLMPIFNEDTKNLMDEVIFCFLDYKRRYEENEEQILYKEKLKNKIKLVSDNSFVIPVDYKRLPALKELDCARMSYSLFKSRNPYWNMISHYLLHGKPGTGKTLAIQNEIFLLYNERNTKVYYLKFDHEYDRVADLLQLIKDYIQIIILNDTRGRFSRMIFCIQIDEIDSISADRSSFKDQKNIEKTNTLLTFFDDVLFFNQIKQGDFANCFIQVYGTTNHPENIDPAVKRAGRMNLIEVLPPVHEEKNAYFQAHLKSIQEDFFQPICKTYTELCFEEDKLQISEDFVVKSVLYQEDKKDFAEISEKTKKSFKDDISSKIKELIIKSNTELVNNQESIVSECETFIEIKQKMDKKSQNNVPDIYKIIEKNKDFYDCISFIKSVSSDKDKDAVPSVLMSLNKYKFINN